MSSSSDEDRPNQWLRDAIEFRRAISDALISLPDEYPADTSIPLSEFHEDAHKFLFEYFSMFEPAKNQLGGGLDVDNADEEALNESLWWEPISTARIPVDGSVRLNGQTNLLGDEASSRRLLSVVAHKIPTKEVVVNLANLRPLFQSNSTFAIDLKGWVRHQGEVSKTVQEKRYLSPKLIYDVRLQLDKCLAKTGKVPNFSENARPYNDWRDEFEDGKYEGPDSVDLPHKNA